MPENAPTYRRSAVPRDPHGMPYVQVAPGGRYFMTEDGKPFLLIGHNEAMKWPYMRNMRDERDLATTEAYLRMLAERGVTVLRIMLEYCQDERWYCIGLPEGVQVSLSTALTEFSFDALGRPVAPGGRFSGLAMTIASPGESRTVTVNQETGYVQ